MAVIYHLFMLSVIIFTLRIVSVLSYLQFIDSGVTQAASSSFYISGNGYGFLPSRTVDGNFSQNIYACLHTAASGVTEAWLRIDLESIKSVKSVKFWYRNDRSTASKNTVRLLGYRIKASTDTNLTLSTIKDCFIDPAKAILPTIIDNECKTTARYIWFYQTHVRDGSAPILEICEVKVFGCETGSFGENCTKSCDHCKNKKNCDIDTGQCDEHGCFLPGFQPPACIACKPERHGTDCNLHCSPTCRNGSCYSADGVCLDGCKPGYQGPRCNQTCLSGQYGINCSTNCGNCFQNMTCNYEDGSCPNGCDLGFKGTLCKKACGFGEYGENCLASCSGNCFNGQTCDSLNGHCSKCAAGYKNSKCDEVCDNGTYGEICSSKCGSCLNSVKCNPTNGLCPEGCEPGWQVTEKCDSPCRDGTFGANCLYACSGNCLNNETCDKRDGGCSECGPGWKGHFCNESCDSGKYGLNCQRECGHCFKVEHCFPSNGSCSGGCIEGYRGDMCLESIFRSTQDPDTPYVAVIAVLVGVIVVLINVIAVGFFILRNARKKKETNSPVNDVDMYDLPNAKTENSVYDVISTQ